MNTVGVQALAVGPKLEGVEVMGLLGGVSKESEGDGVVKKGWGVSGFCGLKGSIQDALAWTEAGVASALAGLESLGGKFFVCVIRFVLAKEYGGGECLEERAKEFGEWERREVAQPRKGGMPLGFVTDSGAGVEEGKNSEVFFNKLDLFFD